MCRCSDCVISCRRQRLRSEKNKHPHAHRRPGHSPATCLHVYVYSPSQTRFPDLQVLLQFRSLGLVAASTAVTNVWFGSKFVYEMVCGCLRYHRRPSSNSEGANGPVASKSYLTDILRKKHLCNASCCRKVVVDFSAHRRTGFRLVPIYALVPDPLSKVG